MLQGGEGEEKGKGKWQKERNGTEKKREKKREKKTTTRIFIIASSAVVSSQQECHPPSPVNGQVKDTTNSGRTARREPEKTGGAHEAPTFGRLIGKHEIQRKKNNIFNQIKEKKSWLRH